jgi:hypothetical protein
MGPRTIARAARAVSVALLLASVSAEAQVLRDTHLRGAITLRTDERWQSTNAPGQPTRKLDEQSLEEEIALHVDGSVVSPRIFSYLLGGSFGLRQGWRDANFGGLGDSDGILFGYDASLNLFPTSPVSGSFVANRFRDRMNQSFGTDTESNGDLLGATVRAATPWIASTVSWRRLDTQVESLGAITPTRRSERRNTYEYTGERFTATDQVLLRFRDEDVADDSFPASSDYHVREASALIGRRFGPYLEKNLRGSVRWFDRSGDSDYGSLSGSGTFDWAITDTLRTLAQYDYNRFEAGVFDSTEHSGSISLNHELYQSLQTRWSAFATRSERDDGGRLITGTTLDLAYRKKLPWQSQLTADLRGGYRYQDNDFRSGLISVRSEALTVNAFAGNLLANPRVDPATIRVFAGPSGPPLVEGLDYEIDVIGDRVAINVFPGGLIGLGDVLAVDYEFLVNASATTGTVDYSVGVGWSNEWLLIRFDRSRQNESLIAGSGTEQLQDSTRDNLRLELSWSSPSFEIDGGVELGRERSETFDYDEIAFLQSLRWRPTQRLDLLLYAREARRDFVLPARRNDLLAAGGATTWTLGSSGQLRFYAEYRSYQDTLSRDQVDIETGIRGQLRFGRLDVIPALRWTHRMRGRLDTEDAHVTLSLRRSF